MLLRLDLILNFCSRSCAGNCSLPNSRAFSTIQLLGEGLQDKSPPGFGVSLTGVLSRVSVEVGETVQPGWSHVVRSHRIARAPEAGRDGPSPCSCGLLSPRLQAEVLEKRVSAASSVPRPQPQGTSKQVSRLPGPCPTLKVPTDIGVSQKFLKLCGQPHHHQQL